jgi:hypothetical protein
VILWRASTTPEKETRGFQPPKNSRVGAPGIRESSQYTKRDSEPSFFVWMAKTLRFTDAGSSALVESAGYHDRPSSPLTTHPGAAGNTRPEVRIPDMGQPSTGGWPGAEVHDTVLVIQ